MAGLADYLSNAKKLEIRGVITTSKRSCESLGEALKGLCSNSGVGAAESLAYLSTIPFYVVGAATATAVREIQARFKDHGFTSALVRGEQSGTGEQLGKFIVEHHPGDGGGELLYLTGDKNRDTVPSILTESGIPFRPLQVYETRQRPDFQSLLEVTVDSLSNGATPGTFTQPIPAYTSSAAADSWWAVYFAPSTARFALPATRDLLASRGISLRIATIGPVTTSAIEKTDGPIVQVTAAKPDPLSLADGMKRYDESAESDMHSGA
ncbi:hypothetical protein NMY22_g3163 [Coprinellus aureogranulatus]|nr:hypothetical protein NMY22_g3163 [Coprinellus aureogranulatus]